MHGNSNIKKSCRILAVMPVVQYSGMYRRKRFRMSHLNVTHRYDEERVYSRLCCICGTERNVLLNTPSCIKGPVVIDVNLTCLHSIKCVRILQNTQ